MQTSDVMPDTIFMHRHRIREMTNELRNEYIFGIILAQFSLKKGVKVHGQCVEEAGVKELTQFMTNRLSLPLPTQTSHIRNVSK